MGLRHCHAGSLGLAVNITTVRWSHMTERRLLGWAGDDQAVLRSWANQIGWEGRCLRFKWCEKGGDECLANYHVDGKLEKVSLARKEFGAI